MPPAPDLPAELAADFRRKWDSFEQACETAAVDLSNLSTISQTLPHVFLFSDFIAHSCIRDPLLLVDLIGSGDLTRHYAPDRYNQALTSILADVADEASLSQLLRRFRRREMVRIGWRDLSGMADLKQTVRDLSALADSCLEHTRGTLHAWLSAELGVPAAKDGSAQDLVIIGLGKLGSRELNFSSDVDVMFAYPSVGETRGGARSISNEDFFARLCRRLIQIIGQPTADGIVFRVDTRLRPYGDSGPLVMSFDAMERYYQSQGREWERYALIKARVVAGDQSAGNQLLVRLNPFIYRRYLDYGAFESLREMKRMISVDVQRKGMQRNIKLGPGGIREIEFFGQVFQLIRGGVIPELQERNIQRVLEWLARNGQIPRSVCHELNQAYTFLRNTEHRLQEFADQQTHDLPSDENGIRRLALSMGFADPQAFGRTLQDHLERVHAHFVLLLESDEGDTADDQRIGQLHAVWRRALAEEQSQAALSAVGFADPQRALGLLVYLRDHLETRGLSPVGRQRLDKLIPRMLLEVGQTEQPVETLGRMVDVIKTIERRTSYLALLLENTTVLTNLVKLVNASPWMATFLSRHPVLLDELMDPRTLYYPPTLPEIQQELGDDLSRRMERIPNRDLELQIEQLCIFQQVNMLRVAAADVTGIMPLMRVSDYLSEIAAAILDSVVELAWQHLIEKHGQPSCRVDEDGRRLAVIGYGKLGGLELGYGSDLDLVFLHAAGDGQTSARGRPIDNSHFFNRLGQRVIHILTSHTRAGKLYDIDMRLRPSGSSGVLVSHIDAFRNYQLNDAWTWEHQALIRARPICGDPALRSAFEQIRKEVLGRPRNGAKLKAEVLSMRERMRRELLGPDSGLLDLKQGPGGMVDIEFLVQYLVLLNAHRRDELVQWTDNVRLIQSLMETQVISEYTAHVLKHAYLVYRAAAHRLSLQEKPAAVPLDRFAHLQRRVQQIWSSVFQPA